MAADRGDARLVTIMDRLEDRLRALRHPMVNRVLGGRREALSTRVDAPDVSAGPAEPSSLTPLLAFVVPAAVLGALVGRRYRRPG